MAAHCEWQPLPVSGCHFDCQSCPKGLYCSRVLAASWGDIVDLIIDTPFAFDIVIKNRLKLKPPQVLHPFLGLTFYWIWNGGRVWFSFHCQTPQLLSPSLLKPTVDPGGENASSPSDMSIAIMHLEDCLAQMGTRYLCHQDPSASLSAGSHLLKQSTWNVFLMFQSIAFLFLILKLDGAVWYAAEEHHNFVDL